MKKNRILIALMAVLFLSTTIYAQVSIHPAGATADSSAVLDISASDKGLLIPRMDSTSRKNIVSPAEGLMVFDSTYNNFWYYDGSAWTRLNGLDQQDLRWSNDSLYLSNDATTVQLGDFKQNLSITNDTLRLSNSPTAIDFGHYKDNLGNHIATQNIQLNGNYLGGEGDTLEGIFIDTLGGVTINKGPFSPENKLVVDFEIPTGTNLAIQNTFANRFRGPSTFWQSFTVPYDGFLSHLIIKVDYQSTANGTFELFKGVGDQGELVTSAPLTFVDIRTGRAIINDYPVKAGEVYTYKCVAPVTVHYNNSGGYPGGYSSLSPAYDLIFQIYIKIPPNGYQFLDTALLINNYTLPITDGNPNEILVTDGMGKVNWANASSGAMVDHLGNHIMTQDLQLNGYWINNDGDANEGIYLDNLGQVGINILPQANFHVAMGPSSNPGFRVDETGVRINEYVLPVADGTADQTLMTDGAGAVSWTTVTPPPPDQQLSLSNNILSLTDGGAPISLVPYLDADNLGNHTASQNLYLDTLGIQYTNSDSTGLFLDTLNSLQLSANTTRMAEFVTTQSGIGNYIEINNSAGTSARFGAGGSGFIPGGDVSAVAIGNFSAVGGFNMWTGATKRVQISAAGNVGIGRTATTNLLEVAGAASKSTAGNWLANSDARLKQNIQALDAHEVLDNLLSLQGISYEWADDQTGMNRPIGIQYGFTAQNVQEVFPTLVSEDQQGYLQTAYGTYDAITIEAIRALNNKLEKLDTQTSTLEEEMDAMAALRSKIKKSQAQK